MDEARAMRTGRDAALLALIVFAISSLGSLSWAATLSDVVSPSLGAFAVFAGLRVAADDRLAFGVRRAWAALSAGVAMNTVADLLWLAQSWGGEEPPFPSFADPFYLAQYPLMVVGLALVPSSQDGVRDVVRMLIDVVTVTLGASLVLWHVIIGPAVAQNDTGPLALLFSIGIVVGDLLVLAGISAALLRRPPPATRAALAMFMAGILLYATGDILYAVLTQTASYVSGSWVDIAWLAGIWCFGAAAVRQREDRSVERAVEWADQGLAVAARALPYLGLVLGLGMVVQLASRGATGVASVTVAGAAALAAMVVLRETVAAVQTARLNATLAVQNEALQQETQRSERLLLNILPEPIAARLKQGRTSAPLADRHEEVTVLFADLVGFTALSAQTSPEALVALLDEVFSVFDTLAERHGLEKIKTIGDAYMAVAGLPTARQDHAEAASAMALAMLCEIGRMNATHGVELSLRIGLHSGPVVAGVIGHRKFSYDLWGDTVNTASRMESHGLPGAVQISEATAGRLGSGFRVADRGVIDVKGKGPMRTWWLVGGAPA